MGRFRFYKIDHIFSNFLHSPYIILRTWGILDSIEDIENSSINAI
jgi:hypothetical protein